ncbi:alpha/beta hydrolase [Nocardioides kribbensis]|uniref:Alpha/beta hydrolase n=1 Tax=Nocardioides kribbensis TaxID=305517 RepID=A0ABV1NWV5_9ACTN
MTGPLEAAPRLVATHAPRDPEGVVVVLHGGANRQGDPRVSPTQLSVLRMVPTARRVARAGGRRLAVVRLLNSHRGWAADHTPLDDLRWAMARLREQYGDLPVGLVGHSLGGRVALLGGAQDGVVSVVALNPWVYPTDGVPLPGRRVLVVHGQQDRIAQPSHAEAVARRIAASTDVGFIRVPEGKHAMLRHGGDFDGYAAQFSVASLLGADAVRLDPPVAQVLAGEEWVTA